METPECRTCSLLTNLVEYKAVVVLKLTGLSTCQSGYVTCITTGVDKLFIWQLVLPVFFSLLFYAAHLQWIFGLWAALWQKWFATKSFSQEGIVSLSSFPTSPTETRSSRFFSSSVGLLKQDRWRSETAGDVVLVTQRTNHLLFHTNSLM